MISLDQDTPISAAPSNVEWQEGRVNRVYRLWHEYCAASPGTMAAAKIFIELDEAVAALAIAKDRRWVAQIRTAAIKRRQKAWMAEHPEELRAVAKDMKRRGARLTQGAA